MFESVLKHYFSNLGVALSKSFVRYTSGVIDACSFSTHEIARQVSKKTGYDLNTSEKGLNYLLSNAHFQVDDHYWRQHIKMVFDLMEEQELMDKREKLLIQVDFTSNKNYFLILSASMIVNHRSIPLYFTMRNHPNSKGHYNQKKMEQAFLKGLKHVLSKKYSYVIVADRGFGNERFITCCQENGFGYLIRIAANRDISLEESKGLMCDVLSEDGTYQSTILPWKKDMIMHRCSHEKGTWYLLTDQTSMSHQEAEAMYMHRFKIETCFQDLKSSGFNIEKSKIRKYANYKRLLAMTMVAHSLLVMLGHVIVFKLPSFLKNSTLMANVILAYFLSEERLLPYLRKND